MPLCERIIIWHLNNDDYADVMKYLRPQLSTRNRFVLLGRSYLTVWIKYLVQKENRKAERLATTSEFSTSKPVSSSTRMEPSPAEARSIRQAIVGSNQTCSSGAKSIATASDIEDLKPAKVHEQTIEPHGKEYDKVDHVADTLTEWEGSLLLAICTLAGWAYGGYIAACYVRPLIFGLLQ